MFQMAENASACGSLLLKYFYLTFYLNLNLNTICYSALNIFNTYYLNYQLSFLSCQRDIIRRIDLHLINEIKAYPYFYSFFKNTIIC